eukprot:TRINITY_DN1958_c0_g1_i4.p1 TRINITY_DN1958_c0_g1~~TRINITY_DN1958_c0_g1_i4.p1  ORF type:complete len:565 (+),score=105.82 TRINITY_DN1958_c0_g1_i4:201-1895(+)
MITTSLLSIQFQPPPHLFLSPVLLDPPTRPSHTHAFFKPKHLPPLHLTTPRIADSHVTRSGLHHHSLPDPELVRELLGRAEAFLFTVADAAVTSSSDAAAATTTTSKQSGDWLSGITNYMETILKVLKDGLSAFHVPYAYGFAIILLTVLVKAATFPLTKRQVESAMSVRSLQPQIKAIQQRYAGDQERIQMETARLYKLAGVNPLAGCLPTLATIPVWIGLYRALSNVADEGLLTEGFFWIPSLSGPTTIAARQNGSGISWLFPFVDGHPPLGWSDTLAYLVLPVLLVISQYVSVQIMQSSQNLQGNDPNQKTSQALTNFLPLMIGYFSLSVPSGLSLYWFTNNILSTAQQVWLQKLGGAKIPDRQYSDATIKADKPEIPIPRIEAGFEKTKSLQGEKAASGEPQRGERFKQIREQERRRRQLREEEKRKAQEAPRGADVINEKHKQEDDLVKVEGGTGKSAIITNNSSEKSAIITNNSSDAGATVADGTQSTRDLKEDKEKTVIHKATNGGLSHNGGSATKDELRSFGNLKKESLEAYSSGDRGSIECSLDRREEAIDKDEA